MKQLDKKVVKQIILEFDLNKKTRKEFIVHNRFYFYNYLYNKNYKLKEIAELFNTTHVAVLYGIKKISALKEKKTYKTNVEFLNTFLFHLDDYLKNNKISNEKYQIVKKVFQIQKKLDEVVKEISKFSNEY